jgi:hypothetical protein
MKNIFIGHCWQKAETNFKKYLHWHFVENVIAFDLNDAEVNSSDGTQASSHYI